MQDFKFIKQDLRKIFLTLLLIIVIFGVLYYLESSRSLLTKMLP